MSLSLTHEALLRLLRDQPEVALRLLPPAWGIDPEGPLRALPADLTEPVPVELRADLALLLREGTAEALGLVVEVQLSIDPQKRWTWPCYVTQLRLRHRLPFALVVIAPSPAVAAWARAPIAIGPLGSLQPWVIGPEEVPAITDPAVAQAAPALAALSALFHARGPRGAEVAGAALAATSALDPRHRWVYTVFIAAALGPAQRALLEALMLTRSDLPAELNNLLEDVLLGLVREKARAEGLETGLEKGLEKGLEEGLEKGLEKGLRQGIQMAWAARFAEEPMGAAAEAALGRAPEPGLQAAMHVVVTAPTAAEARAALLGQLG